MTNTKQYSNKQKPGFCKDTDASDAPSISPEARLSAVNSACLGAWSSQGPKYFTEEMYIAELVCSKFMSQTPRQLPNYRIFSKAVKKTNFFGRFLLVPWLLGLWGARGHISKLPCVNTGARNMSFQGLGIKAEHQILEDSQ